MLGSLHTSLPVDGVFLRLHGAMYAEGIGPPESVLVEEVRSAVGPEVPIACTFDLHGNIPARLAAAGDILVGLKTAPHTDGARTAEQAWRILVDALFGAVRPVSYVLPIPIMLPGEKAMTTSEPFRSLVERARQLERTGVAGHEGRILAATVFVGCAWTDSIDTGMSVVVTADGSRAAARAAAVEIAREIWEARHEFSFGCQVAELAAGVARAVEADGGPVFLTDSGDNVTASTPGDLPIVLRYLVEHEVRDAVVAGLTDPEAVERCFSAGEGRRLRLSMGATVEKSLGPPLSGEARVVRLVPEPRMAVVDVGGVEVVLTRRPAAFANVGDFELCGIELRRLRVVVVKQGYLFPGLTRIAARHIMLLTPGAGDMRTEGLPYSRRRVPLFPLEPDTPFDPEAAT